MVNKKIRNRVRYFLAPLILMMAGNAFIYSVIVANVASREMKIFATASLGLILFVALLKTIEKLGPSSSVPIAKYGSLSGLFFGLVLGTLISISAAFLLSKTNNLDMSWDRFRDQLPFSATGSIAPATVEEAVFRFGIVHGTTVLAGPVYGLMAGSLPFGAGHLLNRLAGQPVTFQQVIGITVAGLLLSLMFLRFGLWASVGCHFAWNALAGPWVKGFGLPPAEGISSLEGAWTTSLVLGLACVVLLLLYKRKTEMEPLFRAQVGTRQVMATREVVP